MKCKYCEHYYKIPSRYRDGENRTCRIGKATVVENTPACELFQKAKIFYCNHNEQFFILKVCQSRFAKKVNGCAKCKDGEEIARLEYPRDRVILRRKNQ